MPANDEIDQIFADLTSDRLCVDGLTRRLRAVMTELHLRNENARLARLWRYEAF